MNLFAKQLLYFFLTLTVLIIILNTFQGYYNDEPGHYKLQYNELYNMSDEYNGIIIGNSRGTHGIQPSILDQTGIKFYNFSFNGGNTGFYLKWWENLSSHLSSNLEYCVIAVDHDFLHIRGRKLENDAEFFSNKAFLKLLFSRDIDKSNLIQNRFPILKYRARAAKSFQFIRGNSNYLIEEYDRGFVPLRLKRKNNELKRKVKPRKRSLRPQKKKEFLELLQLISDRDIKIIFVLIPQFDLDVSLFDSITDFLPQVAKEYNIPFLKFNEDPAMVNYENPDYYTGPAHFNSLGSSVFSAELAQTLSIYNQK